MILDFEYMIVSFSASSYQFYIFISFYYYYYLFIYLFFWGGLQVNIFSILDLQVYSYLQTKRYSG